MITFNSAPKVLVGFIEMEFDMVALDSSLHNSRHFWRPFGELHRCPIISSGVYDPDLSADDISGFCVEMHITEKACDMRASLISGRENTDSEHAKPETGQDSEKTRRHLGPSCHRHFDLLCRAMAWISAHRRSGLADA